MIQDEFILQLQERLQQPLPGPEAQYKMAHAIRHTMSAPPPHARIACTLALFYPKAESWYLPLIERQSSHPKDRHGGQISFPGGKLEEGETLQQAALRETQEEIGITPEDVHILGRLTELYIPVSNFLVQPFIGYVDYVPVFIPQQSEVKSLLEVPLSLLQEHHTIQFTDMEFGHNMRVENMPYYNVHGHIVWGATAMMLSELLEIIGEVMAQK